MLETELYTINIGPQHPSAHGGLRIETTFDGEVIDHLIVHLGFVHRSIEKIAESRSYPQFVPFNSRLDYLASNLPTMAYCQAVEKMLGIEVPERAEYIRIITGELNRIASHLLFIGSLAIDLGATTGFIYCMRDREKIMDMLEMLSGQRMISSYNRIGGVAEDLPEEFFPAIHAFLDYVPKFLREYDNLMTGNEIFQARLKGVGVISPEMAMEYGTTGPNLRASGVDFDLRKKDPYGIYDRFDFKVPLGTKGDSWDRYIVRVHEIAESASLIRQALKDLPEGEFKAKVSRIIKPKAGTSVYHRIESAKGELGYFIVSDGTEKPYRLHVRAPSFINLMVLPLIAKGEKFQDLIANIATLDPVLGEVDR